MRILVHDFGGYAFAFELSRELTARGHTVSHVYCASHQTTPPGMDGASGIGPTVCALRLRKPLDKYRLITRWRQEREYGRLVARECHAWRPSVVISGNAPLSAQHRLLRACQATGIPLIYWLQDLIGEATRRILGKRLGWVGQAAGRYFQALEARLLKSSAAVVPISADFVPMVTAMGVQANRIHVIENWAPLAPPSVPDPVPLAQKIAQEPCLLYTGTLSMKHNPELLVRLAEAVAGRARVVVLSQGMGAHWLRSEQASRGLTQLTVLPYQPTRHLPALYAAATVLVAILDEDASVFSVPSKVLTYLAAGRPLLLAVPAANLAARLVARAGAGTIVPPQDSDGFGQAALELLADESARTRMGRAGRAYAKKTFQIERIADRFLDVVQAAGAS